MSETRKDLVETEENTVRVSSQPGSDARSDHEIQEGGRQDAQDRPAEPAQEQPKPEPSTRILLIRHGLNDYVKEHRLAGRTPGVHLNEEGRGQALALAERLGTMPIAAVYSSPLERARETAEPLAARLGLTVHCLDGAAESDCGQWTGQSIEELSKGNAWRQVQVHPSGFRFPGGESFAEIQARMIAMLETLKDDHLGQTVVVVSHADPIKLGVAFHTGVPLDLFQRLVIAPASITELEFTTLRPLLVRLNDCAYLPPPGPAVDAEHNGR